ncbi:hypothetical protein EON81_06685 [bacterium]|nr:MAG: hypothetical protein EON81_06685 [bacterium]
MPTDTATVRVSRTSSRDIGIRSLELFVDDEYIADIPFEGTHTLELKPGTHTLKASNRLYKRTLDLNLRAGETVDVSVGNILQGAMTILTSVFGTGPYKVFIERT